MFLNKKKKEKKVEVNEEVEVPVPVAPVVEKATEEETEEPFVYKVVKALPTQQVRSVMGEDNVLVKFITVEEALEVALNGDREEEVKEE